MSHHFDDITQMPLHQDHSLPRTSQFVPRVSWPVLIVSVWIVTYFVMDKLIVPMDQMSPTVTQKMIQMPRQDVIIKTVLFLIVSVPGTPQGFRVTWDLKRHRRWSFSPLMMLSIMKTGKYIKKYLHPIERMQMDVPFLPLSSSLMNTQIIETYKNFGMMVTKSLSIPSRKFKHMSVQSDLEFKFLNTQFK